MMNRPNPPPGIILLLVSLLTFLACVLSPTAAPATPTTTLTGTATAVPSNGFVVFDLPVDDSTQCQPLMLVMPTRVHVDDPAEPIWPYDPLNTDLIEGRAAFQLTGLETPSLVDILVDGKLSPEDCNTADRTCGSMTLTLCAAAAEGMLTTGFEQAETVTLQVGAQHLDQFLVETQIVLPILLRRAGSCELVSYESRHEKWQEGYQEIAWPPGYVPTRADDQEVYVCEEQPVGHLCFPVYDDLLKTVDDNVARITLADCSDSGECRLVGRVGERTADQLCFGVESGDALSCYDGCALAPLMLVGEGSLAFVNLRSPVTLCSVSALLLVSGTVLIVIATALRGRHR